MPRFLPWFFSRVCKSHDKSAAGGANGMALSAGAAEYVDLSWDLSPRDWEVSMVTMAKASLISKRSTLSKSQPVFASSFSIAPIGARVNSLG